MKYIYSFTGKNAIKTFKNGDSVATFSEPEIVNILKPLMLEEISSVGSIDSIHLGYCVSHKYIASCAEDLVVIKLSALSTYFGNILKGYIDEDIKLYPEVHILCDINEYLAINWLEIQCFNLSTELKDDQFYDMDGDFGMPGLNEEKTNKDMKKETISTTGRVAFGEPTATHKINLGYSNIDPVICPPELWSEDNEDWFEQELEKVAREEKKEDISKCCSCDCEDTKLTVEELLEMLLNDNTMIMNRLDSIENQLRKIKKKI